MNNSRKWFPRVSSATLVRQTGVFFHTESRDKSTSTIDFEFEKSCFFTHQLVTSDRRRNSGLFAKRMISMINSLMNTEYQNGFSVTLLSRSIFPLAASIDWRKKKIEYSILIDTFYDTVAPILPCTISATMSYEHHRHLNRHISKSNNFQRRFVNLFAIFFRALHEEFWPYPDIRLWTKFDIYAVFSCCWKCNRFWGRSIYDALGFRNFSLFS